MIPNIVGNPSDIGVVKGGVHLIKHEERRRLVRVHCEEKSKSCHCLLSSRKVLHVSESLERRHGMVLDSVKIRFIGILNIEVPVSDG
jgi:hypothetical protein